ncbi:VgrG protein [Vibrio astriarenae]|nr:VgrG protein [Vibrio sp. C7]
MALLLKFTLTIDGIEDDTLVVCDFEGHESLSHEASFFSHCHGFHYDIGLASRRFDLSPFDVVDREAQLTIFQGGKCVQRLHGVVSRFTQGETGRHHTFYRLSLVPAILRLSLHHDRRIFQKQSVPEIIATLLQEADVNDYTFALTQESPAREFCVQYRETNLAFIERLAAEEGLVYHHEHMNGKHTVVFTDAPVMLPMLSEPVIFHPNRGGVAPSAFISSFKQHTQRGVAEVMLEERHFQKPDYRFTQSTQGHELDYQRDDYAYFDFPGRYSDDQQGQARSKTYLDYLRREQLTVTGQSNEPLLRAGYRFSLTDHDEASNNRDWTVVHAHHKGQQPQALEEVGSSGATTYHNAFTLIPANTTWRASPSFKPQAQGPEVAVVVGPKGEEIYCDEYGRVRIQFPWDRYSASDDSASCWVRVAQGLAGSQYGFMALPRVGDEVVVSFINGDPDQPMITGRTYHETNTPPYPLPENKTKTVFRSKTHQGEGFNELSFEDQAGEEKLYLHAQKEMEIDVLHDQVLSVKHDQHTTIDHEQLIHVKQTEHHTIDGHYNQQVGRDHSLNVKGSMHYKASGRYAMEATEEVHLKAGKKVVIEASRELTLKVGGSFIKLDPSGVNVTGAGINLNSGGSAGRGKGVALNAPSLPIQTSHPQRQSTPVRLKCSLLSWSLLRALLIRRLMIHPTLNIQPLLLIRWLMIRPTLKVKPLLLE